VNDLVRAFPFRSTNCLEPPAEYARLRADEPLVKVVMPSGDEAWLASRYADIRAVYTDPRFSRTMAQAPSAPKFVSTAPQTPVSITCLDPPEHTRLRKLIARAFQPRRIEALRPRVRGFAEQLLDELAVGPQPADLVTQYAQPLSIAVICDILGVPYEDRERFRTWGETAVNVTEYGSERVKWARAQLDGYISGLIAEKRANPEDDLLSVLTAVRDGSADRLSEDELLDLGVGLLLAGYETTARQLACSVLVLLKHPLQLSELMRRPETLGAAVEELLRYVPLTTVNFIRVAREDVVLGGVLVKAGEAVIPAIVSANRDDAVFADPHCLDLARTENPHLAFGHGPHFCVGANLARLELEVAIGTLFRRFPHLKLAANGNSPPARQEFAMVTLADLYVSW
jgi:cytochrome P450